jgi:hypothetical protein
MGDFDSPLPDNFPFRVSARTVNYACSIGFLCQSTQILKRINYKFDSYPFDWIFSNCQVIAHCIHTNFEFFLDKTQYIDISEIKCGHKLYNLHSLRNDNLDEKLQRYSSDNLISLIRENDILNSISQDCIPPIGSATYELLNTFNHHNPCTNENHHEYLTRCVDRFKDLIKKKEPKLFVMISVNLISQLFDCPSLRSSINTNDTDLHFVKTKFDEIVCFNNFLKKQACNYTLLFICHIPNKTVNYHKFMYFENIHFLILHTISTSDGSKFINEDDNLYLDDIMKMNYHLI